MVLRTRTIILVSLIPLLAADISGETVRTTRSFDSTNDPKKFSTYSSHGNVIRDDNHKPVIQQCKSASLNANILENENIGTPVITVLATDEDPPDSGGTITYSLIYNSNERENFKIDNVTGAITSYSVFDRDEPIRQKELYVTVKATDNGKPILADVCSIKITILDANDNQPIFDKVQYDESISEDINVNKEVMRISATDIDDGDNAKITYEFINPSSRFQEYFKLDPQTGVITLLKSLTGEVNKQFKVSAMATDHGIEPRTSDVDITMTIIGSEKKPPTFVKYPLEPIHLSEDFNDYDITIVPLEAESNIEDPNIVYTLVTGKTQQSNKDLTFKLIPKGTNQANIVLGKTLDYESINEYTLTVTITNADKLRASININIQIKDVNDNIPFFIEGLLIGSVFENEDPGAPVMQVRAIDLDGTAQNNIVTYKLVGDTSEKFNIDPKTGNITTKQKFDRELTPIFSVRIVAEDNSDSALYKQTHKPNSDTKDFQIVIEDRNDNSPFFTQSTYIADHVMETTDIGKDVITVTANDKDTAATIYYSISEGNIDETFEIEVSTGKIRVHRRLDFETTENYTLRVVAEDGNPDHNAEAEVIIKIVNENDEKPVFDTYKDKIEITEEDQSIVQTGCILILKAYDGDIKDRNAPQNIVYSIINQASEYLRINDSGCITMTQTLDREGPYGDSTWQVIVQACDDGGAANCQKETAIFVISLKDINDNAPYLINAETVWYENKDPGIITYLEARDDDSDDNGPPFTFKLGDADSEIRGKFDVQNGSLMALVTFDREEKKFYDVPIDITDNPRDFSQKPMTGTSYMRVIIGDENDNEMKTGSSSIFVYDYNGQGPDVRIGRVFVEDLDDWDLEDKTFVWAGEAHNNFLLNEDNGTLTKIMGTPLGRYNLQFRVTEKSKFFPEHSVSAYVEVIVKEIPEEAVIKSGSIRLQGITAEEFVEKKANEKSKMEHLQGLLAQKLNTSTDNVDVFTVFTALKNSSMIDVRFSAHGSPYYQPVKLNSEIINIQDQLMKTIGGSMVMINIDECLLESVCNFTSSCKNDLHIDPNNPAVVYTNRTSFVGVSAIVYPKCICSLQESDPNYCLNHGTPLEDSGCDCPDGFEGPHCEKLDVGFTGNGWALYPTFEACNDSDLSLSIMPHQDEGLIFYVGPQYVYPKPIVRDFMALELREGYPVLLVDYGTGIAKIETRFKKLTDGERHRIDIRLQLESITMKVDGCSNTSCIAYKATPGANKLLNVNGPLQVGGIAIKNLKELGRALDWEMVPMDRGFHGCIHNLTFNRKPYDLGNPAMHEQLSGTCDPFVAKAVTFGIDTNFLIAILICIAILIFLLLAVVVHRRKHDNLNEKDVDDIRANIINYEDEGGGEADTAFNLDVLRRTDMDTYMGKPPIKEGVYGQCPEVPDISGFLDTKKDVCDKDPENNPFDDVRHYAYEGDGNTSGSLSSLASCTDEGDLKFNYLSSFGPRFRKLADMCGEEPSDDDSHDGGEESWC